MSKENSHNQKLKHKRSFSDDKRMRAPVSKGSIRARHKEDVRKFINGAANNYDELDEYEDF